MLCFEIIFMNMLTQACGIAIGAKDPRVLMRRQKTSSQELIWMSRISFGVDLHALLGKLGSIPLAHRLRLLFYF